MMYSNVRGQEIIDDTDVELVEDDTFNYGAYMQRQLEEVRQLRMLGKHFREIGDVQLQHAAFRSARQHVRDLRTGIINEQHVVHVRCYCCVIA